MLKFFRNYQKIFFVIIAFFIIVTFSFFGTQGLLERVNKIKDKDIATAIDGSKIKLSEIQKISVFLATDNQDISYNSNNHLRANLFNPGIIKDLFRSGMAKIFFEKYFDELKPSFQKKFDKIKRYVPFTHLYDSSINAKEIYERYTPEVLKILDELKSEKELNVKFLNLLSDLYVEQLKLPSETMRRFLIFQEKQKKVQPDPRLYQDSIAFFGFENAIDWFGIDFLNLISEFIINTSIVAEKKGYSVPLDEASLDLMNNLNTILDEKAKNQIDTYYKNMLHYLSMDENTASKIWQKVLLYKRYFNDVSNNTLIDSLATKEFDRYTKSKADIKLYSLPKSLHINNFENLIKLEMYLLATSNKKDPLDIPKEHLDLSVIEKNYPELIERKYSLNMKHLTIENIALKIKVKDMYFWQLQDENWNKIRENFVFIPLAKEKDDKTKILDSLDFSKKAEIDAFSRVRMVKQNPKLIEEALKNAETQKLDFYLSLKDPKLPVQIKDAKKIISIIDSKDKIENYTEDSKNFYCFEVLSRSKTKELQSFEKAKETKNIDRILNRFLKEKYFAIREEHFEKFITEDGEFKDFGKVRNEIAEIVFSDVIDKLKALQIAKNRSLDDLAKYRCYLFIQNFKQNLLSKEPLEDDIKSQFDLIIDSKKIARSKNPSWIEKKAFSMDEKNYSQINLDDGNMEFFYLNGINNQDDSIDKVSIAKNAISFETSNLLAKKLLKMFEENKCIVLPVRDKDERF